MDYPHREIRFTTTEDGVDIAFWEIGRGKPLIILNLFSTSHAELEWSVPSIASFYLDLAQRYRVVRFDPRGISLSGEPPGGWGATTETGAPQGMSTREMGLDITAVASALDLDSFALLAVAVQGPVAVQYAATHSEVSELILCDSFAAVDNSWISPIVRAELALNRIEGESGPVFTIWERIGPPDEVEDLVGLARAALARDVRAATTELAQLEWDAQASLPDIETPTLILHTRDGPFDSLADARHLAAEIKGSRMVGLAGDRRSPSPYWTDRATTLAAIDSLLAPDRSVVQPLRSGFRTVVVTDIVGSTQYLRSVGDDAGRAVIRELEHTVVSLAADHGGRVVKNLGDGSLVSFGSNSAAITFAVELQRASRDGPLGLRVGMAAGEPIEEDGDIHGTVVAHASRIADLGEAGQVIVSDSVRQLASGKGFDFQSKGDVALKGFDEPERVWLVTM